MWKQRISASFIAAAMVMVPVERAQASDAAKIIGTGIVICALTNCAKPRRYHNPGPSSYQRQQNRQVQSALNYFGYHVGVVDGSIGPRSRAAISQYQAQMGFTPDGGLEPYERDFLLTSHQRALSSAHVAPYNQVMATQGPQGLLRNFRNQELGLPNQMIPPTQAQNPYAPSLAIPAPTPSEIPRINQQAVPGNVNTTTPVYVPPTRESTDSLPSFPVVNEVRSISAHCNEINVLTSANGGISTAGQIRDAGFALNEQFCLSRTHAMADSARIKATLQGMTEADLQAHCDGLTRVLSPEVEALGAKEVDAALSATRKVLDASGSPIAQLAVAGKVCLGVGYRRDDAELAMASALLLSAAGETGYAESVSHHLREGFGVTSSDTAKGAQWMTRALSAAANGAAEGLGQSADRLGILRAASTAGSTRTAALPAFATAD